MPSINLNEVESKARVQIPKGVWKWRFIETEVTKSSKNQHPMIMATAELLQPASVVVNGERYGVAGLTTTYFFTYGGGGLSFIKDTHKALNLPMEFNTDDLKPLADKIKGLAFDAESKSEITKSVSDDEAKTPIVDPVTGQQLEKVSYRILTILRSDPENSVTMAF